MHFAWTAARAMGLSLILMAVSLAAVAATIAPEGSVADATWGGMKLLHLILGMLGAGATLFFLPQFTLRWLGATVTCGILCAIVGTPFLIWAFTAYFDRPFPAPAENVLAIVMGVAGVNIIPTIQYMGASVRANPWGFLSWIRGGAAAPPPVPPADTTEEPKGGRP